MMLHRVPTSQELPFAGRGRSDRWVWRACWEGHHLDWLVLLGSTRHTPENWKKSLDSKQHVVLSLRKLANHHESSVLAIGCYCFSCPGFRCQLEQQIGGSCCVEDLIFWGKSSSAMTPGGKSPQIVGRSLLMTRMVPKWYEAAPESSHIVLILLWEFATLDPFLQLLPADSLNFIIPIMCLWHLPQRRCLYLNGIEHPPGNHGWFGDLHILGPIQWAFKLCWIGLNPIKPH